MFAPTPKMNYYIIFPTAAAFAADVGVHPAYCATLIGATSFGGIFAGVFHVYLLSKNLVVGNKGHQSYKLSSFRGPLLLASFFPIVGNTIYALAVYRNSLQLVRQFTSVLYFACEDYACTYFLSSFSA